MARVPIAARVLLLMAAASCCVSGARAQEGGMPLDYRPGGAAAVAAAGTAAASSWSPAADALLNARTLSAVVEALFTTSNAPSDGCPRARAARPGTPEAGAAGRIASLLGVPQASDVLLVDLEAPGQSCHAAVALSRPDGAGAKLATAAPGAGAGAAVVVAFRGNTADGGGSLLNDLQGAATVGSTFRGQPVDVLAAPYAGLFARAKAAASSCEPATCAGAIATAVDQLAAQAGASAQRPLPVLVTGHGLGAASAVLFALHLDDARPAAYNATVHTFGQPMVGVSERWQSVYDGDRKLGSRTYRWVRDADPVPLLPSRCQQQPAGASFRQVGTQVRLRTADCGSSSARGECSPAVPAGAPPQCVMEQRAKAVAGSTEDCSVFVGARDGQCYCGAMPTALAGALLPAHAIGGYAASLAGCRTLAVAEPAAQSSSCAASAAAGGCSVN